MTYTDQSKVQEPINHIGKIGGATNWYAGISSDPRDRLFNQHCVKENGDWWIYREFSDHQVARQVEQHLIDRLGTTGGPGGGDWTSKFVYAYVKGQHTRE